MATLGATMAISAIMLLSPAGAGTTAGILYTHPYHNMVVSLNSGSQVGGCGKAKVTTAPHWASTSGKIVMGVTSSAPSCKSTKTPNEGISDASVSLSTTSLNFAKALSLGGTPQLNISVTMTTNASYALAPYSGCHLNYSAAYSICQSYAEATFFSYAFIDDQSNGTWGPYGFGFAESNFVNIYHATFAYVENYSQNYCYLGNCTHYGGNFSVGPPGGVNLTTVTTTTTFNLVYNFSGTSTIGPHDTFSVQIYFSVEGISECYAQAARAIGTCSASANLNAGSHGNGIQIVGIALT